MKSLLIHSFIIFHLVVILVAPLKPYKQFEPLVQVLEFYTVPFYFLHSWALFSPNPGPINYWNIKINNESYNWPESEPFKNSVSFLRSYYYSMDSTKYFENYKSIFLPYLCGKHGTQNIINVKYVTKIQPQLTTNKSSSKYDYERFNCKTEELL